MGTGLSCLKLQDYSVKAVYGSIQKTQVLLAQNHEPAIQETDRLMDKATYWSSKAGSKKKEKKCKED